MCVLQHHDLHVTIPKRDDVTVQQMVAIGVRSERIHILRPDNQQQIRHLDNTYHGRVQEVIFQGDSTAYVVQLGDDTIRVVEPNVKDAVAFHKNDEVIVGWRKGDVIVLHT